MLRVTNNHTAGIYLADGTMIPAKGFVDVAEDKADMIAKSGPLLDSLLSVDEAPADAPKPKPRKTKDEPK